MINENFRKMLKERLKDADLKLDGMSLDDLIDTMVMERFETKVKRDITLKREHMNRRYKFTIPGLKQNATKGFDTWAMNVEEHEVAPMFERVLSEIVILISEQFERCNQKKILVDVSWAASVHKSKVNEFAESCVDRRLRCLSSPD